MVGADGELKSQALPSWALSCVHRLSDQWGIGVQADNIIESFDIEHGEE